MPLTAMTNEEFQFWQRAYLAALQGLCSLDKKYGDPPAEAIFMANQALQNYRWARGYIKEPIKREGVYR